MSKKWQTMDGNEAAAYAGYGFTEVAGIYPITPSSPMGEHMEKWSAFGKKNYFGAPVKVVEMQSEAGAAGAVHGSLKAGALTTTFTASQGLLLKIPNMYKMSGELLPGVLHVTARSIAAQSLSIFGDHQDIYAARQTGWTMMATSSVQEVMDLAGVAHLAAIKSSVPVMHFFDGFRTSHEVQKIETMDLEKLHALMDQEKLAQFRARGMNPEKPAVGGTAQNDDIYFQTREVQNKYYDAVPKIIADYFDEITKITGREYKPFNYYGAADATDIIIAMGSVCETIKETIDYLVAQGKKVGLINVHLYRPFSKEYFMQALPKTTQRIAVLDRTKEPGSAGEPLFLDVVAMFNNEEVRPTIITGRYGLSSKDTTPGQIKAIYTNLAGEQKSPFTVGINDDVTFLSLTTESDEILDQEVTEALFFGLGSDGTIGANKSSIKIIGDDTDNYAQGYYAYDSKKAGGVTRSHLRFGKNPIRSTYLVNNPTFVSCSRDAYLEQYDLIDGIRPNGTFLLNTVTRADEIESILPDKVKKILAQRNINFYIIDAGTLAKSIGLGNRTNTILQSAFFSLNTQILPYEKAVKFMKEMATKSYSKKGQEIVDLNHRAIDLGTQGLVKIDVKPEWADIEVGVSKFGYVDDAIKTDYVKNIVDPVNAIKGYDIPVSAFVNNPDGVYETGTTQYEKRTIADFVPKWKEENCIQCNQCAYSCPHAVIRPVLLTEEEIANSPVEFRTLAAIGKDLKEDNLAYRIQVSTRDCTGCEVCVTVCPGKKGEKALVMEPIKTAFDDKEDELTNYLFDHIEDKSKYGSDANVKSSQFLKPLFEYSGACAGCGETPYIKLVTQLFGDHMIIANATGCTSIYGGSAPVTPYTTNSCGEGPTWSNSLFEDNAEFGFGLKAGTDALRGRLHVLMDDNMDKVSEETQALFKEWFIKQDDFTESKELQGKIVAALVDIDEPWAKEIITNKTHLVKKSVWSIGGDGWAYDIGYGGLDHVIANQEDINILILDTEVYSNTGGQSSKSSPTGSIAKFTAAGKNGKKKDMAAIAMSYGHVYVAQVAMNASPAQLLKAVKEAEAYNGPSIIIAYSTCIEHGIAGGMKNAQIQMKKATECGYWPIFRYDPRLEAEGKNPLQIDCKEPNFDLYDDYISSEKRYSMLKTLNPDHYEEMLNVNKSEAMRRWKSYARFATLDFSLED